MVLLVEDEPFVREATSRILKSAGFDVLPAADAQEAMKVYELNRRNIDLLMTDLGLPGRNGRQLAQDVRSVSAETPILLTSGYVEVEWNEKTSESGTYFLPKPYCRADLVEMIERILSRTLRRQGASNAS
jgi:DNA-binding response OmpR family regulator